MERLPRRWSWWWTIVSEARQKEVRITDAQEVCRGRINAKCTTIKLIMRTNYGLAAGERIVRLRFKALDFTNIL